MSGLELHAFDDAGGTAVVAVHGELDLETAPRLTEWITEALQAGPAAIAIDLAEVTFIDSSGLTAILQALDHAQSAGTALALRRPSRQALDLLAVTGLDHVLTVEG